MTGSASNRGHRFAGIVVAMLAAQAVCAESPDPEARTQHQAFFGELHIHSANSYDAHFNSVRATPEQAYRFGLGEQVSVGGVDAQLRAPLDFMAVTDHAMYLGVFTEMDKEGTPLSRLPSAKAFAGGYKALSYPEYFKMLFPDSEDERVIPMDLATQATRSTWHMYAELADRYYEPGKFTTLVGFEWTAAVDAQGLHRNVIFRDTNIPDLPFSAIDSRNPEDLWLWMDGLRNDGKRLLAIPHNPNQSNGLMFPLTKWDGSDLDREWAQSRMRNEPVVEITQIKGTSETTPMLSPTDELAAFEIMDERMGTNGLRSEPHGSYVRDAYKRGIEMQASEGFNPYQMGVIGSSDGHNSVSPIDEDSYSGKMAGVDDTADLRRNSGSGIARYNWSLSASGLAGVWAESNTREEIFDALQRKEVFATSGPRIRIRLFGGWNFPDDLMTQSNWVQTAYASGTSMGSTLPESSDRSRPPRFAVFATKDPAGAWLQRIQIVKGWVDDDGESQEKVFDVACSDDATPQPDTHRCPDNGATVNTNTCDVSRDKGAVSLGTLWEDPEFQPDQHAFYYARAIENPTCRWTTWEANRNGWPHLPEVSPTVRERAWSSPIWYSP